MIQTWNRKCEYGGCNEYADKAVIIDYVYYSLTDNKFVNAKYRSYLCSTHVEKKLNEQPEYYRRDKVIGVKTDDE